MAVLTVRHLTRYRYARPVRLGEHRIMYRPREAHDQRILEERIVITPEPTVLRFVHDVFGNSVAIARFAAPTDRLTFESAVTLDHRPEALDQEDAGAAAFPPVYSAEDAPDLLRSIERDHPDADGRLERWARRFAETYGAKGALAVLAGMTRTIHAEFGYAGRLEIGTQTPLETLHLGTGSCRDFAVLMIEAARCLNTPRASCPATSTPKARTARRGRAAATRTPGCRRTCRTTAGWSSIPPTASSATPT